MRTTVCAVVASIWALSATAQEMKLRSLIEEALQRNPEILAAQKAVEAARQRPAQASSLPDPMLQAGYASSGGPLPVQGLGTQMTSNIGFSVSQQIPAPGKRRLRGEIAEREAEAVFADYARVQLSVIARVKQAWHELHHAQERIELLERSRTLLERVLKVTEARYATGAATQQDVLKAQTQLSLIAVRLTRLQQSLHSRVAAMNQLLGRAPDSPLGRVAEMEPRESVVALQTMYEAARNSSPLLRREEKMIQRAELATNLARKDSLPDFTVMGGYYNMGRMPDMFEARVEFNLPSFTRSRQRAAVAEQVHTLSQARRNYQAADQSILLRIKDDYLLSEASWRLMKMYADTLIPQATLTLESTLPAYETGQVDFLTLLNNVMAVFEYEENYHEEFLNYHLALIRLEEMTGLKLVED